jgi:hypothetical protein
MTTAYEQAFHTCCRNGLTSSSLAFQFNAASPGLDARMLAAIQSAMTGYTPPAAAPPAPSEEEIARFPVSLRYREIEGVGPCISRTAYVGREDRSGGGPGEGRFGNYFSHVVACPGSDAFEDGLRPIELWDAPFWTTDERPSTAAEAIPSLAPAADVAGRALTELERMGRLAWIPPLLDAVARAIDDDGRVVIVDEPELGWAWIGAATLCVPVALSRRLTFDTFDAEPHLSPVTVCATDPSVDRAGLARKAHTGELVVLDPAGDVPPAGDATLIGRAAAALIAADRARDLPELARRAALRPRAATTRGYGALLAIETQDPTVLRPGDVLAILDELTEDLRGPGGEAATGLLSAVATDPSAPVDAAAARAAAALLGAAVEPPCAPAGTVSALACLALRRCEALDVSRLPRVPAELLGFDAIGQALALVSEAVSPADASSRVGVLAAIGIVGANAEVDRQVGRACAPHLSDRAVMGVVRELAGRRDGRDAVEHCLWSVAVMAQRGTPPADDVLVELARRPVVDALASLGEGPERWPAVVLMARARVAADPRARRRELERLLARAASAGECEAAVHALYATTDSIETVAEIVQAHATAERLPPPDVLACAWALLGNTDPFRIADALVRRLARQLYELEGGRIPPPMRGLSIAGEWLERTTSLRDWSARIAASWPTLTPLHAELIIGRLAREVAAEIDDQEHAKAVEPIAAAAGTSFLTAYVAELEKRLARPGDADLARAVFKCWRAESTIPGELRARVHDEVLPDVLRGWAEDDREDVGELLAGDSAEWAEAWFAWCRDNPPAGAVGRAWSRLRPGRRS